MDKVDLLILSYLKNNARMKASDISKEINFSVSSVIERIKKLEKSGIIEKYTIVLDENKLGNNFVAIMEISLSDPTYHDAFTEFIKENKSILSCYHVTGDFDFILKVRTNSADNLEKIHREIKCFKGVQKVKTFFSMKEIKCETTSVPENENR